MLEVTETLTSECQKARVKQQRRASSGSSPLPLGEVSRLLNFLGDPI